jgi:hypothetical protein
MNEEMQEAEWYMLFAFFIIIWMVILMMVG